MVKRVVIAAGGTGGHIFPALAVAELLEQQGAQVTWIGTRRGLETQLVPDRFARVTLPAAQFNGRGFWARLSAVGALFRSLIAALRVLKQIKPDSVLAMGGYVSAPVGLAAWLLRYPLIIHEQNAKAGLTNRILSRLATNSFQAFPDALVHGQPKTIGNPLRGAFFSIATPAMRYDLARVPLRILVLGGSQGAQAINEVVSRAWCSFGQKDQIEIWHQTGRHDYQATCQCYGDIAGQPITVVPFIDEVANAYAWADLVICRAGALTISELAAVGVASILVPYPFAADNHQRSNAEYLTASEAAICCEQAALTEAFLHEFWQRVLNDRQILLKMAQSAKSLSIAAASEQVAAQCMQSR